MSRVGSLLRWGQQKAAAPEAASALEPDPDPPEITGRQTLNPIGGMHYLAEHTDIVRHLCRVAPTQFASASDDHSIVIWDTETHRSKAKLLGHTMPVTCMLVVRRSGVDGDLLLSGSTDKSVRVWDLETAQCISTWETHGGTIKTLADLRGGLCCSGGHDLCVWSIADGRLVSRVKWDEEYDTDVRQIIGADNGNVIIAACDDRQLLAYRVRRGAGRANVDLLPIKKLVGHREPVQCLHKLTEHAFASGSLDGSICLWDAVDLQMTQVLNYHETYVLWDKSMHTYLYSVHHVTSVGNWLVAATGSGFSVFNIVTGTRVAKQRAAHGASVSKILLFGTEEELCVVTASVDAAVKIWDLSSCCPSTASSETQASPILELARKMTPISPVKSRTRKAAPRLIGHLYGHTGAVNDLIETDSFGFASCSSDRAVISWRNAVMEWQRLNEGTVKAVDHFFPEERPHTPPNGPEGPDDLQTPTKWNASV